MQRAGPDGDGVTPLLMLVVYLRLLCTPMGVQTHMESNWVTSILLLEWHIFFHRREEYSFKAMSPESLTKDVSFKRQHPSRFHQLSPNRLTNFKWCLAIWLSQMWRDRSCLNSVRWEDGFIEEFWKKTKLTFVLMDVSRFTWEQRWYLVELGKYEQFCRKSDWIQGREYRWRQTHRQG